MRNTVRFTLAALALCAAITVKAQTPPAAKNDTTSVKIEAKTGDYANPQRYVIKEVTVSGVQYQNTELLKNIIGLHVGDTVYIPGDYATQALNKLWNQKYFSDAKILAQPLGGDSVRLEVYLKERQRVYTWKFNGVRKGQTTEITEKLKLRRGSELSPYALDKSVIVIQDHFKEKGFRNTTVTPIIKEDTSVQNGVIVTFDVVKGHRVKVGEIVFDGNEQLNDKKLRGSLKKTHQKNIKFWQNTKLKDKEYADDLENLIDYYNSKGFRNAHVVSDSIYTINDKRIGVNIKVGEGNKYYIRNVSWVGNSLYETEQLQLMLGVGSGDTYDKKTMHKRLGIGKENDPEGFSVSSLYQNKGYIFSQIEPAETIIGADSIDLEIKIFEGNPASVNSVVITGNMRVDDDIIRRELYVQPGELYDRSMLMATIRQLSQMQHFNPEAIAPDINPVSNELVDISFALEEQASDKFEISGGWGAGMFVGSVGIQLNNLSLKNFLKGDKWRPYPQGQGQQLVLRAQSNGTYYKSFSVNFTEPWLGGRKPHSLSLGAYYSDETNAMWIGQKASQHFRTIGVSAGMGRRLSWPDYNFSLYMEGAYQRYNMQDWDYFLFKNGNSNVFSLKTVFGRSTVDQPIYPRRGSDFSVAVTLTPPYSLFDDKDYKSSSLPDNERYKWIEYHKWQLKAQWFYALDKRDKLVLMAKAEMGYLGAYNPYKVSPFEQFDVGGDGMSGYTVYGVDIIGLRGYENGSLTPVSSTAGQYARAYNKYTVELRYPFILKPSSQIYGLVFAEGGNAFSNWQEFDPFLIKRSLGVGIRMYLPVVGMLGVDWGYGFDHPAGSNKRSGGQPHFVIGMQF